MEKLQGWYFIPSNYVFVNLAQVCWFLECARLPFNRNKPQIIKIINFETRRRIVNDELEKLLIKFLKRLPDLCRREEKESLH